MTGMTVADRLPAIVYALSNISDCDYLLLLPTPVVQ